MITETTHKQILALVPAAVAKNTALAGVVIDTEQIDVGAAGYISIYLMLGANDSGLSSLKLQGSEQSGAGFVDLAGSDFSAAGNVLPGTTDVNSLWAWHISAKNKPRYIKIVGATANAGVNGVVAAGLAVLSRLEQVANSASKRGVNQELFL